MTRGRVSFDTVERRLDALDDRLDRIRVVVSWLQKSEQRARGDRRGYIPSVAEARERYPHGTNARFVLGRCRCFACRVAKSEYWARTSAGRADRKPWRLRYARNATWYVQRVESREVVIRTLDRDEACAERDRLNDRDGERPPSELIDVATVRRHLRWLAKNGIGCKTVHQVSGVSYSVLQRIAGIGNAKTIKRTRRSTAERILAVGLSDATGAQKVPAGPTWERIDCLLAAGWKRWEVAVAITPSTRARVRHGCRPGLQIRRDYVRGSTAARVEEIHREAWRFDHRVRAVCQHVERFQTPTQARDARNQQALRTRRREQTEEVVA